MSLTFTPQTEKQIAESNLVGAGVYPFEVATAESKTSKAGNDMIEIQLRIFLPDGAARQLRDYLMEKVAYKLFHFCAFTGLSPQYQAGTLRPDDCVGRTGYVKVAIKPNKETGELQNSVADYVRAPGTGTGLKKEGALASTAKQPTDEQLANQTGGDDSVPF